MQFNHRGRQQIARAGGQVGGRILNVQPDDPRMKAAEAALEAVADQSQSSFATSMSVLAHTWYSLDQAREAARMTYNRAGKLRLQGREMSTNQVVQQYGEAQAEILIVEEQIVEVLQAIVAQEGEGSDMAFGLLAAGHTNVQSGISVRLPHETQVRLALASGILEPEAAVAPSPPDPAQ